MKPEKMIRTILWWMVLGTVFLFIVVWLFSGGPQQVWKKATEISSTYARVSEPSTEATTGGILGLLTRPDSTFLFQLPWQPSQLPQGPITADPEEFLSQDTASGPAVAEPELPTNPALLISYVSPDENPAREYVELKASSRFSLARSSLTTLSGSTIYLPQATPHIPFETELNIQQDVVVEPGENVIIVSGSSPSGTSYKEGTTWYLFLNSPTSLWNFTHDKIELRDSEGILVDRYIY